MTKYRFLEVPPLNSNLLMLQLGRLGDFMCSTAFLPILKRQRPDISVAGIVRRRLLDVTGSCEYIDLILPYGLLYDIPLSIIKNIVYKPDIFVDLNHFVSETSKIVTFLSLADIKLTIATGHKTYPYNRFIALEGIESSHIVDRSLAVAELLGLRVSERDRRPHICIPMEGFDGANRVLNDFGFEDYIAINISAGSDDRMLSSEKWREIIKFILKESDKNIILLSMPSHMEIIEAIGFRNKRRVKSYTGGDFFTFSALISKSSLLISPDTSAIHIAGAFNVPVVGLYPDVSWNINMFGPTSDTKVVIFQKGRLVKDIETSLITKTLIQQLF
ncbi:MAG: hypothetical protein DRH51_02660 [Candidatus Coatesbacteria bacterium]|nr:MAG: hypothetical protein DRH51_02660 [Candidatus Coatesbacteria bacterium]